MAQPTAQPVIIVYGLSGTGKTRFILSHPAVFDRPDVAIHGHPKEYMDFRQARRFGYEHALRSDPSVLEAVLQQEISARIVVLDEIALAKSSFGTDRLIQVAVSGKRILMLAQGFGEAIELAGALTGAEVGRGFRWNDMPLDGGPFADRSSPQLAAIEPNISVLPIEFQGALPPLLESLGFLSCDQ
jgi:hypothetical protein